MLNLEYCYQAIKYAVKFIKSLKEHIQSNKKMLAIAIKTRSEQFRKELENKLLKENEPF